MSTAPRKPVTAYHIERSLQAWRDLHALIEDDPSLEADQDAMGRFLHATGAEPPHTLLAILIDDVIAMERKAEAADNLRKRYTSLRDRIAERAARTRTTIAELLDVLDLKELEAEEGTASIRAGRASVIVTSLAQLEATHPDLVETLKTPRKLLIGPRLKAGETIEGAELSNPAPTLHILPF